MIVAVGCCSQLLTRYVLGIIQNADDHVVKLLEDLVVSYISGNSLILVTLNMSGRCRAIHISSRRSL